MNNNLSTWDLYFLDMAKFISTKSKDPSTKTGAVVVNGRNEVVGTGYNGFPIGVLDSSERYDNRDLKYKMICHCEMNAILSSNQRPLNCTLYTYPFSSCSNCAKYVIQSGIKICIAPIIPKNKETRWKEDMDFAALMFKEAGVEFKLLDYN